MFQFQRTANACYKDAADLHAELGEFPAAIARYEQVADHSLTSALTKYSVKEYWLRAGLCALAMKVFLLRLYTDVSQRDHTGYRHGKTEHAEIHRARPVVWIYARSKIHQRVD